MIAIIFYLSSILIANWLVVQFGVLAIGPLSFPAGTIVIGLTFTARDFVQRQRGRWGAWLWMITATGITVLFNYKIALASGSAFLLSEGIDWLIYTISKKPFKQRILLSNAVSCPLDSIVFVGAMFGFIWPVIIGQAIVKFGSSLMVLPFMKKND